MEIFNVCWLYKQIDSNIKGLIVKNKEDYDLLISQGYKNSPKECKKETPVSESNKEAVIEQVKEDISISESNKETVEPRTFESTLAKVFRVDEEDYDLMTKQQLIDFAKDNFDKVLSERSTKVSLINEIKALKEG